MLQPPMETGLLKTGGSKGAGKTTMIIDAMRKVNADGVALCEAHPDLEVFRYVELCTKIE